MSDTLLIGLLVGWCLGVAFVLIVRVLAERPSDFPTGPDEPPPPKVHRW